MKYVSFILLSCLLLSSASGQSVSPEVVSSAGGRYFGANVSVSWTLGETMVESYETSTVILSQGFQQGALTATSIDDLSASFGTIKVFPIPTRQNLRIEWEIAKHVLEIRLSDLRGRELLKQSFQGLYGDLDLSHLSEGVYFLHLSDGEHKGRTIRIQKE